MKLQEHHIEKIKNSLKPPGKEARCCPICGDDAWTIAPNLWSMIEFHRYGAVPMGGSSFPCAVAVCNTCSFVASFNAIALGILKETGELINE